MLFRQLQRSRPQAILSHASRLRHQIHNGSVADLMTINDRNRKCFQPAPVIIGASGRTVYLNEDTSKIFVDNSTITLQPEGMASRGFSIHPLDYHHDTWTVTCRKFFSLHHHFYMPTLICTASKLFPRLSLPEPLDIDPYVAKWTATSPVRLFHYKYNGMTHVMVLGGLEDG